MKRFWDKVDQSGGPDACWPWSASKRPNGYGQFGMTPKDIRSSHRVAFELTKGSIPDGMMVCHTCDSPACCNPLHLFLGSHTDNMADMTIKGRSTRGRRSPFAKLDENQVRDIRRQVAEGHGLPLIAAQYGISKSLACMIGKGKRWAWL